MFRIDELHRNGCTTLLLSGTFTSEHVPEARAKLEALQQQGYIVELELSQLRHIDREGIALLIWATGAGRALLDAPRYVITWITQEGLHTGSGDH